MKRQKTSALYDQKQSVEFYENRYEQGYMDEWPIEKKRKIFEVIQDLQLPAKGEALDVMAVKCVCISRGKYKEG